MRRIVKIKVLVEGLRQTLGRLDEGASGVVQIDLKSILQMMQDQVDDLVDSSDKYPYIQEQADKDKIHYETLF